MPGRNSMGPTNQGPLTGRGLGSCNKSDTQGFYNKSRNNMNYGTGQGLGRGLGQGFRRGCGRGFGQGFGRAYDSAQASNASQKEILLNQKEILENQLEELDKLIEEQ